MNLRTQKESSEGTKKERTVTFNPVARVILIPSRQEYHDAELAELLWWTRKELKSFQLEAKREIRQLMRYTMYTRNMYATHFSWGATVSQTDDTVISYSSNEDKSSEVALEDCA